MPHLVRFRSLALTGALLASTTSVAPAQRARSVPAPADVIGFVPGTDRKLPPWSDVVAYFTRLDAASPRLTLRTLGKTTLGRPFLAAFIADSATLANLPRYREIQRRLADPRLWPGGANPRRQEKDRLIADGKTIVLVTSSIHSTEVGGILTPLVLAHRLVTGEDDETRAIRKNTIVILVPSLNPDGVDIVGNWYRATLGTSAEGTSPPELYHHYVGHDNNRDWYAFTQVETQMTVDSLHNVWHPQIVNDIHQQGSNGSRIFIPPYMDPIEPNIDPIIMAGVATMGKAMTWRLTADGKVGIANNTSYDAWTPARAYQHYHGGIRILTETASADLASPITVAFDSLRPGYNVDPKVTGVDYLTLWKGGRWGIGNIVDYQTSATWALLAEAARNREEWLRSFAKVSENAVAGPRATGRESWPAAYVIPSSQKNPAALATVLGILQRGAVEIRHPLQRRMVDIGDNVSFEILPTDYVVTTAQPYGSFAKTLLEAQHYPDLHEYPGGPPIRPYDVTAHTLPLLMGVGVMAIRDSIPGLSAPIAKVPAPALSAPGLTGSNRRIGLYRSYVPSMDEGWTRFIFDTYHVPYMRITDRDVRAGSLNSRFDAIVIPDESPNALTRGARGVYPDSVKGGLGAAGAAALKSFVENGGTLVTFNEASNYAIGALQLPVRDVLEGIPSREFYAPGSIFTLQIDTTNAVGRGMPASSIAWFEESPAFEVTDPSRATIVARYPASGNPLLSGWLLGADKLAGRAALVDVSVGRGHVILFGFRPQYRAQTLATYPLLWNALRR